MTKQELCKKLAMLLKVDKCNDMILRQINKYVTEHGWSYLDIARAFAYFVEIEGNVPDPRYGIAIVKFKMEEARKYFAAQELKQQQEKERIKRAQELEKKETKVIQVNKLQNRKIKLPLLDITKF